MAAEMCDIKPGQVVAVWGAGPVGQFAIASARLLGAERVIAIDRLPYRLEMALQRAGATDAINYEQADVAEELLFLTAGRGPDAASMRWASRHTATGPLFAYDRMKQVLRIQPDRPFALRQAIRNCRNGGVVSVAGVYGGFIDEFPMGVIVNRGLTLRSGQCHVQRYFAPCWSTSRLAARPQLRHHAPPALTEAPRGFELFLNKLDNCEKVVLHAA